jgi:hypothetical protein
VTERQSYILRVRELAKACGEAWLKTEGGGMGGMPQTAGRVRGLPYPPPAGEGEEKTHA